MIFPVQTKHKHLFKKERIILNRNPNHNSNSNGRRSGYHAKSKGSVPLSAVGKKFFRNETATIVEKGKKTQPRKAEQHSVVAKKTTMSDRNAVAEHPKTPVRIIPLGGLGEIGKNLTVIECANDMFVIDCGMAFPDAEMPGVDSVIPDFTYLEKHADRLRGVVLTHGHEDHIGGLAYLLKKINVPVYGTQLTLALVESKLKEHHLVQNVKLNVVKPRQTVRMGCMAVEFIHVNHSIPDAVGLAVHTPAGVLVHTGDFKVDYSPINGGIIDLARFGELGSKGVLALMADSTNAERSGFTPTERTVGESFEKLFATAEGKRIIVATFSSNVHRVQQIINCAERYGRKVVVMGRSMVNVMNIATKLGHLQVKKGTLIEPELMNRFAAKDIVLITTGSQGEPMSALTRMAMHSHKQVAITPQDYIIISATPIPGNEKYVTRVVNELMKSGAQVVYERMYEVHVSGHACQEELKLMLALTKPKFFIPVHGEYKHLKKHAQLAVDMGIPKENVLIAELGNVIETNGVQMKVVSQAPCGSVMVDGLGVGDVGAIVLRDRKHLAQDGLIIVVLGIDKNGTVVSGPELISRGFVYVREAEEIMEGAKQRVCEALESCSATEIREWNTLKLTLRDVLIDYIREATQRRPMILPIIMEME